MRRTIPKGVKLLVLGAAFLAAACGPTPPVTESIQRLFADEAQRSVGDHRLRRMALSADIPSRSLDRITVPAGGALSWQHAARSPRRKTRVVVTVSVVDRGVETIVFESAVHSTGDRVRNWQPGAADLSEWAGRTVEIAFDARYEGEPSTPRGDSRGKIHWASPFLAPSKPPSRPSVIVLLIDTLRADRLGVLGAVRPTPNIDALAAQGTLFTSAFSQADWTLPSTASLFSGKYPVRHGVRGKRRKLKPDAQSLPRLFARSGYYTTAFHDGGFLHSRYGFADGFDEYRMTRHLRDPRNIYRWLEEKRDLPFFLLLHTYAVHAPYNTVPREYWGLYADESKVGEIVGSQRRYRGGGAVRGREPRPLDAKEIQFLEDLHDGEVRFVDDRIAELLAKLDEFGLRDRVVLVLTSDHGEEFGERGRQGHNQNNLHPELVNVPLLLVGPGIPAGKRIDTPVQVTDLLPTLTDLYQLEGLERDELDGESLAPFLSEGGPAGDRRRLVWSERNNMKALRSDRWTLIAPGSGDLLLYDRIADPEERVDVAAEHPEVVERMSGVMQEIVARSYGQSLAEPAQLDESVLRELRALGYVD